MDSPLSRGPPRSPIVTASHLQRSPFVLRWHRSPSPYQDPIRTSHRQLYKCCTDDVPLNASLHSNFQCVFVPICGCLYDIHPISSMLDHLRLKDNVPSISSGDGLALPPMIEAKVGDGRYHHR